MTDRETIEGFINFPIWLQEAAGDWVDKARPKIEEQFGISTESFNYSAELRSWGAVVTIRTSIGEIPFRVSKPVDPQEAP